MNVWLKPKDFVWLKYIHVSYVLNFSHTHSIQLKSYKGGESRKKRQSQFNFTPEDIFSCAVSSPVDVIWFNPRAWWQSGEHETDLVVFRSVILAAITPLCTVKSQGSTSINSGEPPLGRGICGDLCAVWAPGCCLDRYWKRWLTYGSVEQKQNNIHRCSHYSPCWSRLSLHPLCHKVFPLGCRLNTGECRPSPSPHWSSPLCTPSSECRSSPGERSAGGDITKKLKRLRGWKWQTKMTNTVLLFPADDIVYLRDLIQCYQ